MSLHPIDEFGWNIDESGFYNPVRCKIPPAPESITNLIKCGCKTGCSKNCSCRKHRIACSELCDCTKSYCENPHNKIEHDAFDDGEDIM